MGMFSKKNLKGHKTCHKTKSRKTLKIPNHVWRIMRTIRGQSEQVGGPNLPHSTYVPAWNTYIHTYVLGTDDHTPAWAYVCSRAVVFTPTYWKTTTPPSFVEQPAQHFVP
ncbi:unnamed protein product [Allacma fusca]|uniref:Uncharacterized protein n=1 Tax=Allacma fusca TaxID=39272 RepID=A0A8J2JSQ0_9HEXA|nr:unnamed protein product [Allacma fusca]